MPKLITGKVSARDGNILEIYGSRKGTFDASSRRSNSGTRGGPRTPTKSLPQPED